MAELDSKVFNIEIDNINSLCGLKLEISKEQKWDRSVVTDFHKQILKTRQMIFSHPEILVALSFENKFIFYAIATKAFYTTQSIQNFCREHNIKVSIT